MLAVWWVNFEYFCVPGEDGCVWVCGWRSIGCQAWSLVWHWSECKWFTFMETEQVTLRPRMCCDLMNKWSKLTALSVFSLKVPNWGLGCHCFCDPAPSWQFHAAHCKLCFCSSCGLHVAKLSEGVKPLSNKLTSTSWQFTILKLRTLPTYVMLAK